MKKFFATLSLVLAVAAVAWAQTPEEIISQMENVMRQHEAEGVVMTMDMKIPILGTFSTHVWTRGDRTRAEMEEERRLAFVAMTRAEKGLFLTMSDGRNLDGTPRYPSRFVLDIDPALVEYTHVPGDSLIEDARAYIAAAEKYLPENLNEDRLSPGTRVRHSILGDGEILECDADRAAYLIRFDGVDTPRRISYKVKLTVL